MEETLISLETAKLAKEAGFDWDCDWFYEMGIEKTTPTYFGVNKIHNLLSPAPTQLLLQKWLRVNYNYNINVKHITHNQKYGFSVTGNYDEKTGGIIIPYSFKGYDTYEECLENALQQCLNIIKNN